MKGSIVLSVITAITASLCCIVPALGVGTASAIASLSLIAPFRPFLILTTVLMLSFSWLNYLKIEQQKDCGCERRSTFFGSKKFLIIMTLTSLLLLMYPLYGAVTPRETINAPDALDAQVNLSVNGMTCANCEHSIERGVIKLSGVRSAKVSYKNKTAVITYSRGVVTEEQIIDTIVESGYSVARK